ncbi:hypothetical protein F3Y22_tig00111584pilonHSYRG00102 [Hibiscus syriacus]|uniref:Uncharacterized protein n=1 Tax=Hibiscus syriacus TaxID=106335 RepID=A0A6A2XL58_HIBSY|nr:hypothetical protein F3Y22_tig00111584pilonHSYRG00102 [Hibiscus syriacus]
MSAKDCGHHSKSRRKSFRRIIAGILIFPHCSYHNPYHLGYPSPSKPRFILQNATVYGFNASVPTSSPPVSKSPCHLGTRMIESDILRRAQHLRHIQGPTNHIPHFNPSNLPGDMEVDVWSPFINGNMVPISLDFSGFGVRTGSRSVFLTIKIDGRVRWKVGAFVSGRYHLTLDVQLIYFGKQK